MMAAGDRAKLHGLNLVGLKRHGFSPEVLLLLKKAYRIIFRFGLTLNEALERVSAQIPSSSEIEALLAFIKSSQRGITR
jgi:UDP-N-acetylglucosamine acyltransferase